MKGFGGKYDRSVSVGGFFYHIECFFAVMQDLDCDKENSRPEMQLTCTARASCSRPRRTRVEAIGRRKPEAPGGTRTRIPIKILGKKVNVKRFKSFFAKPVPCPCPVS